MMIYNVINATEARHKLEEKLSNSRPLNLLLQRADGAIKNSINNNTNYAYITLYNDEIDYIETLCSHLRTLLYTVELINNDIQIVYPNIANIRISW